MTAAGAGLVSPLAAEVTEMGVDKSMGEVRAQVGTPRNANVLFR